VKDEPRLALFSVLVAVAGRVEADVVEAGGFVGCVVPAGPVAVAVSVTVLWPEAAFAVWR
jgi:hypothetical protein